MRKREASYELLRIIAIVMVLILHYLNHSGSLLVSGQEPAARQVLGQFIESFCIVAVDVWILISGYFLSRSGFKLSRILQLLAEVYFYTLGITLVMNMVNSVSTSRPDYIYKTTQFFFPISSEHYSFATAYLMLYVIAPVLNRGVEYLRRKQLRAVILGLLLWMCFIKSVIPVNFATDRMGYDLDWYIVLYLTAAYIRKYDVKLLGTAGKCLALFAGSGLMNFLISFGFHRINLMTGRFNYYARVPYHYNFIFCFTGALGLFSLFRYITLREGLLTKFARAFAPFSFGIYLLHEHLEIRGRWLSWMEGIFGRVPDSAPGMLLHLILCVIVLFFSCCFVDFVRAVIFKFVSSRYGNSRPFRFVKRLEGDLWDGSED